MISHTPHDFLMLVMEAIKAIVPDVGSLEEDTAVLGEGAVLDSVGLVTLLVSLEEKLESSVDLASSFMAHADPDSPDHPFRTIGSLSKHLISLLSAES